MPIQANNPLLLERRAVSRPAAADGQALRLVEFPTLEAGVLEAVKALRAEIVHGAGTPAHVCRAWSGRAGVTSFGFVSYVCMRSGLPSCMRLDPNDSRQLCLMVRSMGEWLSGCEIPPDMVARCVAHVLRR